MLLCLGPLAALCLCGAALSGLPGGTPAAETVRGQVVLADEGSPTGLFAYLISRGRSDSVAVDASGAFTLAVTDGHCGPLELRIDVPYGTDRRYHRAVVPLGAPQARVQPRPIAAGDSQPGLRILLVPTRVVIDGGTFAGLVVPIHVDAALAAPSERSRYWRVVRLAPSGYGTPIAWPDGIFPIPVTLRARGGVSRSDSAAFWRTARQLELDFGRSLFKPAPDEPLPEEIWKIIVAVEPGAAAPGITFITYDAAGEIFEATVAVRATAYLSDARLVTHELIHALGFGHATAWYSSMGAAYSASSRATVTDVGYAQLLYRLRRAHIAGAVTHGILASAAEARVAVSGDASRCAP